MANPQGHYYSCSTCGWETDYLSHLFEHETREGHKPCPACGQLTIQVRGGEASCDNAWHELPDTRPIH